MAEALLEVEDVVEAQANLGGQIGAEVECSVRSVIGLAI